MELFTGAEIVGFGQDLLVADAADPGPFAWSKVGAWGAGRHAIHHQSGVAVHHRDSGAVQVGQSLTEALERFAIQDIAKADLCAG